MNENRRIQVKKTIKNVKTRKYLRCYLTYTLINTHTYYNTDYSFNTGFSMFVLVAHILFLLYLQSTIVHNC